MNKLFFAGWLLGRLSDGEFFRRLFAALLAGSAALAGLYAVVAFFIGWKAIFNLPATAMAGGIIYQLTFVVAIYAALHAALLRARSLERTPAAGNPVLNVSASYCRAGGEIWVFTALPLGLGGGILNWFAGQSAQAVYKPIAGVVLFLKAAPASFANGGAIIGKGLLYGIVGLLLAYTLAELLTLVGARQK